ncbi:MAG: sodium:proton antiporter [Chloroflexota bacterium]
MTLMARHIARLLLAPIWMVALAILVKGYADTGDGFSAGVVAALGVLLQYLAFGSRQAMALPPVRYARELALFGLLVVLVVTFLPVTRGQPLLTHVEPGAHVVHLGSLELITAVLFDVGVFLLVLGFATGVIDLIARSRERRPA